jgi:hypothetical protein
MQPRRTVTACEYCGTQIELQSPPVGEHYRNCMIQAQLKLRMIPVKEAKGNAWLNHLGSVWNWGVRKIELNAKDKIYFSKHDFHKELSPESQEFTLWEDQRELPYVHEQSC